MASLAVRDCFARATVIRFGVPQKTEAEIKNETKADENYMDIEDLQRRKDELQKRIELVRSYL